MDQWGSKGSGEVLDHVDKEVDENLSHFVEGVASDAGAGGRLGERVKKAGEDGSSKEICSFLGLNKELEGDQQKINNTLCGFDQGTSCSSRNLKHVNQVEHVNQDHGKLEAKVNETGLSKVSNDAPKGVSETDKNSCAIDIKLGICTGFSENLEGEMICRICHLASGQPLEETASGTANSETSTDLIQLGCACKDELGVAHPHCAEAWFKLKGNSWTEGVMLCEICGETAKNVSAVTDDGFIEEWNESRFVAVEAGTNTSTSSGIFGRCGQPFWNFLMTCLVIAFVLPWFFRVNMF